MSDSLYNRQFSSSDQTTLMDIILARRDVRGNKFLAREIQTEHLNLIFEAANAAPSVGLSQPWEFILVRDRTVRQKIYEDSKAQKLKAETGFTEAQKSQYRDLKLEGILEAPINIAVYYNPPQQKIIGNNTMPQTGEYSVVCAIQNMWLMARSLDIGLGWVSIIAPEKVDNLLAVPQHFKLIGYLCMGYSSEFLEAPEFEKTQWAKRKGIASAISVDTYNSSKC
jgi:5,6-dimethylbenzimidazole synthase